MITVDGQGVSASSLAETLSEYESRLREKLGEDLSLDPETPQGQIAGIDSAALSEVGQAIVEEGMANSIDHASGPALDLLGSLLGVARRIATRSRVTATLTGVSGTGVPIGSRARTANEGIFETTEAAILSPSGVMVEFQSVEYGPVEAPAATLTQIETIIPGWETVTNVDAAVLGIAEELDDEYRVRYRSRTAFSSTGPMDALRAALTEALATRIRVVENSTNVAIVVQEWTILPHSILVLVEGGSHADITRAIEFHRGMGVGTMGAVSGGSPDNSALDAISNGTVTWGGVDYAGLDLSGAANQAAKAAALTALISGITAHYEWPSAGYYVALYAWVPNSSQEFGQAAVEEAFGLDPNSAIHSLGPYVRPRSRDLTITMDVTRQDRFPSDGLDQIRQSVFSRIESYEIGEQVWSNDILTAAEIVPGTRVTSLSVQEGGRDISGVDVPLDCVWRLPGGNLTITVT